MTREEKIHYAYLNYCDWQNGYEYSEEELWEAAIGWADEHPKNPWRWLCEEKPPVKQLVLFMDSKGVPHLGRGNIDNDSATISSYSPDDKI